MLSKAAAGTVPGRWELVVGQDAPPLAAAASLRALRGGRGAAEDGPPPRAFNETWGLFLPDSSNGALSGFSAGNVSLSQLQSALGHYAVDGVVHLRLSWQASHDTSLHGINTA